MGLMRREKFMPEESCGIDKAVKFATPDGFLEWVGQGGKVVRFGYGPNNWEVLLLPGESPKIVSPFYDVISSPPYGAPKIIGKRVSFGGEEASGIVEFGFVDESKPAVVNRRRLTSTDKLQDDQVLVKVFQAQPDRVDEPVAVVANLSDKEKFAKLEINQWLSWIERVRDAVELEALRELMRWARI